MAAPNVPSDKPQSPKPKSAGLVLPPSMAPKGDAKLVTKPAVKAKDDFVTTGIAGLDSMLGGGIPKGSNVMIAGGAGSGKTLFTLQMAVNKAREGKRCIYMSFEESEKRLWDHIKAFGWDLGPMKENLLIKRFNLFDVTRSIDAMMAKQTGDLLIDVKPIIIPKGFNPEIVIIDSLTAIASAFLGKEETYRIYIEQLFRYFEGLGITTFLISETDQNPDIFSPTGVEEFLADGVIVLYNIKKGSVRENGIEILKMRGVKHQKKIAAMQITEGKGIEVYPDQEVFGV